MKPTAALIGVALGLGLPIYLVGWAVLALSFIDLF
ncbi:hypothetical protein ABH903_003361 [Brevibacterium epidermidis]|jgi:hypothetical protein|uniref:Uncharacterized protein n=1 Tax=Brevibacterium epidermidis TaxID=1698 RepID=A0ABV4EP55_BREEP